jgi:glycerol-3-phosphate acyltransferase PlsX
MWLAVDAVKRHEADVAISAGNTGALMAMATFILKTMPGIKRPAIAGIWPTLRGESIVLDVGATIGVDAEQLVQFAIMGEAMARCLFGIERPTVGLLNMGVEEVKGNAIPAVSCAKPLCPSNIMASSRAMTSARGRWTW